MGRWQSTSVYYESSSTEFLTFDACGAELRIHNSPSSIPGVNPPENEGPYRYDYAVNGRRLWVDGKIDHEYFVDVDRLALNPFWSAGPHDGVFGRWVRPSDPENAPVAPWAELRIEADGGGQLTDGGELVDGVVFPNGGDGLVWEMRVSDGGNSYGITAIRSAMGEIDAVWVGHREGVGYSTGGLLWSRVR
jgi:hypothetical protein